MTFRPSTTWIAAVLLGTVWPTSIMADEKPNLRNPLRVLRLVEFPSKTTGGRQIWTDQLVFHDWRIQKNSLTGHFRLLDGDIAMPALYGRALSAQEVAARHRARALVPPSDD